MDETLGWIICGAGYKISKMHAQKSHSSTWHTGEHSASPAKALGARRLPFSWDLWHPLVVAVTFYIWLREIPHPPSHTFQWKTRSPLVSLSLTLLALSAQQASRRTASRSRPPPAPWPSTSELVHFNGSCFPEMGMLDAVLYKTYWALLLQILILLNDAPYVTSERWFLYTILLTKWWVLIFIWLQGNYEGMGCLQNSSEQIDPTPNRGVGFPSSESYGLCDFV